MGYSVEETVRLNQLFDIYQELLTEKQRVYFGYYFSEDYSLSEIAEILNVSRNAVHIQIKNIIQHLESFDAKLKLLTNKNLQDELLEQLKKENLSQETLELIEKIEKVRF
jgi:hypothetical protein